ncbi:MAG: 2,3-bisphosphoglycerate-independent phosphoglycerate mutase [Desulfovibrionaceae bacterium]|nr:2,3-bisphosphoglycerate-independent phosphoglycerate mutase [Desulfovibrionaceae bacterium]
MDKPTLLLILDGWGVAAPGPGNAVSLAAMPYINNLIAKYSGALLHCSGRDVGLPSGFMGNSEVGHMNIGAGRVVYQDMTRIDLAVENDDLRSNAALSGLLSKLVASGGRLHFMGLLSDGGVHSHINHLFALLRLAREAQVPAVVHAFLDGRDTSPTSGLGYLRRLLDYMQELGWGELGSACGRYYAMDRDKRWERVKVAWDALVLGRGTLVELKDALNDIEQAYQCEETDEFMEPRLYRQESGSLSLIDDGDGIFFFNFRADRARELTRAFIKPGFCEFEREKTPKLAGFVSMTAYEDDFDIPVAFMREGIKNGLGEVVSNLGWDQLRIAETEKYAHVTYFFNGGREEPFPGDEWRLIPSPKEVPTYDLKPEMSAFAVTDMLVDEIRSKRFRFIVCNLANLDMVGHSGNIPATIKACEAVDACVARIVDAMLEMGGRVFLTADHGNAEELLDSEGKPMTAHTLNPVRFILIERDSRFTLNPEGRLADIAPTIIAAWGLAQPEEMNGRSLLAEV